MLHAGSRYLNNRDRLKEQNLGMPSGAHAKRNEKKVAKGSTITGHNKEYAYLKRCMVSFDDETFDQIREMAVKSERPFSQQVRELVEHGLESWLKMSVADV